MSRELSHDAPLRLIISPVAVRQMQKYPYIVKVSSLRDFLKKIPGIGIPETVGVATLKSLGYTSSNDAPIPKILKFIGFLDEGGKPTEYYRQFRNKAKSGLVMATCLRKAYSELYQTYPDAHNKDTEALRNFFSAATEGGEAVLINTVNTFKALSEFADFEAGPTTEEIEKPVSTVPITNKVAKGAAEGPLTTINVNIQLQLPATEDSTIYDKIFESLKKHLLGR